MSYRHRLCVLMSFKDIASVYWLFQVLVTVSDFLSASMDQIQKQSGHNCRTELVLMNIDLFLDFI